MNTQLLKELRKKYRLTQEELAERINISRSAYCKIETQKTQGTVGVAIALAKALNHPLEELLSDEPTR